MLASWYGFDDEAFPPPTRENAADPWTMTGVAAGVTMTSFHVGPDRSIDGWTLFEYAPGRTYPSSFHGPGIVANSGLGDDGPELYVDLP